jgi:hypothetical protein
LAAQPLYSLCVALTKAITGSEWDHVGVIVRARGDESIPYVFERTLSGRLQVRQIPGSPLKTRKV